jgi:hypothetical protein
MTRDPELLRRITAELWRQRDAELRRLLAQRRDNRYMRREAREVHELRRDVDPPPPEPASGSPRMSGVELTDHT